MEKTIKKAAKKAAAVMLALIMAIAFMPVLSQEATQGEELVLIWIKSFI